MFTEIHRHLVSYFPRLPFSWRALLIAPIAVPLVAAVAITYFVSGGFSWGLFILMCLVGLMVSYSCTVGLLLPGLCVLSRLTAPNAWKVTLLGVVLALAPYLVICGIMWKSSGPDSGPPVDNFFHYLARSEPDPMLGLFLAAGAINAGIYYLLASRGARRTPNGG